MAARVLKLWEKQDTHKGDRKRLFGAVRDTVGGSDVLYPGSYVDVAASMAFASVTYIDTESRAAEFFADTGGVQEIVRAGGGSASGEITFIAGDYRTELGIEDQSFGVSLRWLRIRSMHRLSTDRGCVAGRTQPRRCGDGIDRSKVRTSGVVTSRSGNYRVSAEGLDTYLIPKTETPITPALLHERGRGIPYTKSPFAYLFTRTI